MVSAGGSLAKNNGIDNQYEQQTLKKGPGSKSALNKLK
jgi:hypothetical protein